MHSLGFRCPNDDDHTYDSDGEPERSLRLAGPPTRRLTLPNSECRHLSADLSPDVHLLYESFFKPRTESPRLCWATTTLVRQATRQINHAQNALYLHEVLYLHHPQNALGPLSGRSPLA